MTGRQVEALQVSFQLKRLARSPLLPVSARRMWLIVRD